MTSKHTPGPRCNESVQSAAVRDFHICGRPVFEADKCKVHCESAVAERRRKSMERWDAQQAKSPYVLLGKCREDNERLKADNARLREALQILLDTYTKKVGDYTSGEARRMQRIEAKRVASAALKGK